MEIKYDPARRKGFSLTIKSSSGGYNSHGYNSHGDDRHVIFGIDDARTSEWEDCGRPLSIGFGELDYFSGKIREVRIYDRALEATEMESLARTSPTD